jgi:hypothetical protein
MGRPVIVHPAPPPENGVYVILPCEWSGLPLHEIARKDVPAGLPYIVIDDSELPPGDYREAWDADFSNPDGQGIGPEAWFAERSRIEEEERQSRGQNVPESPADG